MSKREQLAEVKAKLEDVLYKLEDQEVKDGELLKLANQLRMQYVELDVAVNVRGEK